MNEELFGKYRLVLGLEIHLHLKTDTKMFCRCSTDVYGAEPNTHTCPTCLGLPGALPVPNLDAIKKTQILGLALNSTLNQESRFDRKHYFYPDLPKGYQISQYQNPLCSGGYMNLSSDKKAAIERVHLEEDTAKSMHEGHKTLIDFNLSSMPLVEIVTEPTFTAIEDAVEFSKKVQLLVRELDLGDADMEKGQMRLEPNISLRTQDMEGKQILPEYKVEIKNINSFKFMENAVRAEIIRQRKLLEGGTTPVQENRGYVEEKKTTISQRGKEHAHDYRYFPEPDIPPLMFSPKYIQQIKDEYEHLLSRSPAHKKEELLQKLDLEEDIKQRAVELLSEDEIQKIAAIVEKKHKAKDIVNLFLNNKEVREEDISSIIKMLENEEHKLTDESALMDIIKKVLANNEDAVHSYQEGKENAVQYLVGMVMKESKGKADAGKTRELLLQELEV